MNETEKTESKRIHYGNSTPDQRDFVEQRIRQSVNLSSSLVDDLNRIADSGDCGELGKNWGTDRIENIYQNPNNWTAEKCEEYLEEREGKIEAASIIAELKADHPPIYSPEDITDEQARSVCHLQPSEAVTDKDRAATAADFNSTDTGATLYLEALREKCSEYTQEDPAEVFEWWEITDSWIADQLKELGEPYIDNDYGFYWGRTCTGQSIILDPTFWTILQDDLPKR